MRLGKSKLFRVSVLGLLSGLTLTTGAQAQWRDDRHGPVWRDERAHIDHRAVGRREDWHFDRERGWRFEQRPGFWSPDDVWGWTWGRVVMPAAPNAGRVSHPRGPYGARA